MSALNDIDKFRAQFFEKVIKDAEEKERIQKRKQANCFHCYTLRQSNGLYQKLCIKCGFQAAIK